MQIQVGTNIHEFKRQLKKVQRKQLPFAYQEALNDTAFQAMRAAKKHMRETFERPIVGYIPKGITVQKAVKNKNIDQMMARVDLEDFGDKGQARRDIMKPHILGGTRRQKKAEHLFVGSGRYLYAGIDAPRNKFGNLKNSEIVKAISDIGRNTDAKQNTRRRKKRYFAINTNKQRTIIMQREGNTATPFMVEGRKPQYRKRFQFYEVIMETAKNKFPRNMTRRLRKAVKDPRR